MLLSARLAAFLLRPVKRMPLFLLTRYNGWKRSRSLALMPSASVLALILTSLFSHLVENDSRTCAKVQAFDHAEHGYCDAHFATADCSFTNPAFFVPEPNSKFRVFGEVTIMEVDVRFPLNMRRRNHGHKALVFEMVHALFGAVEPFNECPFHRRHGS